MSASRCLSGSMGRRAGLWRLLALAALFLGAPASAASQDSASATAAAKIIAQLKIIHKSQLVFGCVLPTSPHHGGTVTVTPDGRRYSTGYVAVQQSSPFAPAGFTISGAGNAYYTISLPAKLYFPPDGSYGPGPALEVRDFRLPGSQIPVRRLDAGGLARLTVGATLIVRPGAVAGRYKGFVPLSVNYQ